MIFLLPLLVLFSFHSFAAENTTPNCTITGKADLGQGAINGARKIIQTHSNVSLDACIEAAKTMLETVIPREGEPNGYYRFARFKYVTATEVINGKVSRPPVPLSFKNE